MTNLVCIYIREKDLQNEKKKMHINIKAYLETVAAHSTLAVKVQLRRSTYK